MAVVSKSKLFKKTTPTATPTPIPVPIPVVSEPQPSIANDVTVVLNEAHHKERVQRTEFFVPSGPDFRAKYWLLKRAVPFDQLVPQLRLGVAQIDRNVLSFHSFWNSEPCQTLLASTIESLKSWIDSSPYPEHQEAMKLCVPFVIERIMVFLCFEYYKG